MVENMRDKLEEIRIKGRAPSSNGPRGIEG